MFRRWRHSLVFTALWRTAVGGGLLIAWLTLTTYFLIFRAVEQRGLIGLDHYVLERARREEAHFTQVRDNLDIAARAFLERLHQPDPPGFLGRWDRLYQRFPDGAWRTPREAATGDEGTTLWAHRDVELTEELKRRTLILHETLEKLRPAWIRTFRSLWACTPEMTNLGFDPLIPNWVYNTPADWDQNAAPWVAIAMPAENPDRELRWTYSIIEEISGEYFVSVCLPVYDDDRFVAILGHDVRVFRLIDRGVQTDVAGMTHMMFRDDGRIIAHPDKRLEIMGSNGDYSMRDDPELAELFAAIASREGRHFSGFNRQTGLYYAARRLEGPGWFFLTTLPRSILAAEAFQHAKWVVVIGLVAIIVLLGFIFFVLQRGVSRPLEQLSSAIDQLSAGDSDAEIVVARDDELGQLASAFNQMSRKVRERDQALRDLNADLEKRIAERTKQLQTSEARMRAMLENAPEAIVVLDADTGLFRTGNENALRFFDVDRETLRTLRPVDLSPPTLPDGRSSAEVAAAHIAAAVSGKMVVFEWLHRPRKGGDVPCEVRLSRVPLSDRNLLIGTITDISERKQAEARLLESLRRERELGEMKSNFVSMVSHEFRTPLGIISSSAEILQRYHDRLDGAQRDEHLGSIVRSTRRLSDLIGEVMLLQKVESSRLTFAVEPLDLASLGRRTADEVLSSTGIHCPIEVRVTGDISGARGDESLLRHILTNLLSNAVKYSAPGAAVALEIERRADDAVIRVRDRGIGIPAEDLRDLFQAFHRGRNVGLRPGTGLGLVIVDRCIRIHGGRIEVESEVGRGTCFTVWLPLFNLESRSGEGRRGPDSGTPPLSDEDDSAHRG